MASSAGQRVGCWVCTVVTKDKSMEAMIENGEEWLEPMLEYRDLLASTQDPAVKAQVRPWSLVPAKPWPNGRSSSPLASLIGTLRKPSRTPPRNNSSLLQVAPLSSETR